MFDLVVIGGGSGGVRAARIAAGFGAKVAIIEQRFWGGTCVNVGCVPKKMYHYAGSLPMAFELAQAYGWSMQVGELNWQQFHRQKDHEINRLQGIYRRMLANAGVEVMDGFGRVVDAHTVDVDGQTIGAKRILIATGGQPTLLDIPGVEHCLDSDALFALDTLPESLLVIGGGYIACEMASTYEHLGVKVRWINRSKPLKSFDAEMVEFLLAEMAKSSLCCDTGITPVSVELTATGKKAVTLSSDEVVEVDQVLMATGRKPNIEKLGLDAVGVELTAGGHIAVNEDYQTSVESIYAVGDVIPGYDLTPVALEQGMYLAKTLFDQRPSLRPAFDTVATVIFTHPQFANVGMTEEAAKAKGYEFAVFDSEFRHLKYSLTQLQYRTRFKLLVDLKTDRILGIHAVGEEVGEILQGFSTLLHMGITKAQLDQTVGIHPTLAEELVTLREPSRVVLAE